MIDQHSCNKDLSCIDGFCPSFVTVEGGRLRVRQTVPRRSRIRSPEPHCRRLIDPYGIVISGVGGAGIVTTTSVLGMAAHLEGRGCTTLDMMGLAQKGGAVTSHLRISPRSGTCARCPHTGRWCRSRARLRHHERRCGRAVVDHGPPRTRSSSTRMRSSRASSPASPTTRFQPAPAAPDRGGRRTRERPLSGGHGLREGDDRRSDHGQHAARRFCLSAGARAAIGRGDPPRHRDQWRGRDANIAAFEAGRQLHGVSKGKPLIEIRFAIRSTPEVGPRCAHR